MKTHTYTYIHTYIQGDVIHTRHIPEFHENTHTHIHTYIHTYMHAYLNFMKPHTYTRTYVRTYIHAYIPIHTGRLHTHKTHT